MTDGPNSPARSAPTPGRPRYGYAVGAVVAVGLLLRFGLLATVWRYFADDAYIFFRYAQNGADGLGFVYNPGERVMGYTSPLFLLLLTALKVLLRPVPLETLTAGLNLALFALLILFAALARGVMRDSLLFPLLLAFYYPFLDASLNGMETLLFLCAAVGCVVLLQRGRWDAGVTLAGGAALARPEGFLLLFLVGGALLWLRPKPFPARGLGLTLALLLAWGAFATATYGSPVPQSIRAKSSWSAGDTWAGHAATPLENHALLTFGLSTGAFLRLPQAAQWGFMGLSLAALPVLLLALRGYAARREPWALFPLLYLALWLFYWVGRPPALWSWYAVPGAVVFWAGVLPWLLERMRAGERPRARLALEIGAALLCLATVRYALPRRLSGVENMTAIYARLSARLTRDYPAARSLLVADIGLLGRRTGWRVLDSAGLVSPQVFAKGADGRRVSLGAFVQKERPDVLFLTQDPREAETLLEGQLRWDSFHTQEEFEAFARDYVRVPHGEAWANALFVRRALVR